MFKFILISLLALTTTTLTYAKKGNPIPHKHGSRTHTHPLPASGVNHSHNKSKQPSQSDWVFIGRSTDNNLFEAKPGSLEITKNKGGKPIAVIVGQVTDGNTNSVDIYQWYVSLSDCRREMGKLVALDTNGTFKFDNNFVFGGRSMASTIAGRICGAYTYNKNKVDSRGR